MLSTGDERGIEIQGRLSYMMGCGSGFMWEDDYASAMLDRMAEVSNASLIVAHA